MQQCAAVHGFSRTQPCCTGLHHACANEYDLLVSAQVAESGIAAGLQGIAAVIGHLAQPQMGVELPKSALSHLMSAIATLVPQTSQVGLSTCLCPLLAVMACFLYLATRSDSLGCCATALT